MVASHQCHPFGQGEEVQPEPTYPAKGKDTKVPICLGGNRRPRSRRPCVGERVSGILDRKGLMVRPGGITCTAPIIGALLRKSSGSIARGLWDRQPPHRMPPGARQRRRGKDFEAGLYSASLLNCLFLLMERYPRNPQYGPDFRRKISKKNKN